MISLYTNEPAFASELLDEVKLFFPKESFVLLTDPQKADIRHELRICGSEMKNTVWFRDLTQINFFRFTSEEEIYRKRMKKRYAKLAMFSCLQKFFGKTPPWGALTGIRPTKLAWEITESGEDFEKIFREFYHVSDEKIALTKRILRQQESLHSAEEQAADLYLGIPFCVSRCSFCSFSGGEIGKLEKWVEPYLTCLEKEVVETLDLIHREGYRLKTIYIGGGTPTSLSDSDFERVLKLLKGVPSLEFTVEAGRPDTITKEKLDLMKAYGVNRISINPQTFCQATLDRIGRKHGVEEIYSAFELATHYPFAVNADLIAGLPSETTEEFCYGIEEICKISPDNVTIHSLALKRGSALKESGQREEEEKVARMITYAHHRLSESGYEPYYLYRQKYMSANMENVGFCKEGKQCRYNIDHMEEISNIFACGSGAISKRIFPNQNRIERTPDAKDVIYYVTHINEMTERKKELFGKKQENTENT